MIYHLARLGLEYADLLQMRADLLAEFKRRTNDLIHSFRSTK